MTDDCATTRREPLQPGACIGILGGGQLGRMMATTAAKLGFRTAVYSDASDGPALDVATLSKVGSYDDLEAIDWLADHCDVVTYEFENVPVGMAQSLAERRPVLPGPKALAVAQDRLVEKDFMTACGLAVAPYHGVACVEDLDQARVALGGRCILKTRRLGYDGKGQVAIAPETSSAAAMEAVQGNACVLEQRIGFDGELSVVLVRSGQGEVRAYDVPRNVHGDGILRRSVVPGGFPDDVVTEAKDMARCVADALDYVGVLAVEFFYVARDAERPLLINEIAPRVHNSGHWTMDACLCDQFENHVRAIAGWPLGPTERFADAEMTNLIGDEVGDWPEIAADPAASLHIYGKREARDGRKMGHVTRLKVRL